MEHPPPESDATLVRRALLGDDDAYRQIVHAHQTLAFRVAYLLTGSPEDARDATQDGFVKAFQALSTFDVDRPLRPWLLRIVANEARNRARTAKRQASLRLRVEHETTRAEPVTSPDGAYMAKETSAELLAAVNALPEDQRVVVGLRYFAGLSEQETAATLGVRVGTVKSRHSRALSRLRTLMEAPDA